MHVSVWEKESFLAPQDVVIIGGGLVGLWTALELRERHPRLRITILEKGLIPCGASTRNAGFACFGSPSELLYDAAQWGEDAMWQIVEMRYKGMEKMIARFDAARIDFERSGGYEVYHQPATIAAVNDQLAALNTGLRQITGRRNCFRWANQQLDTFGFAGFEAMIENPLEGNLHSGKLVQSLQQMVQAAGVQLFTGAEVTQWEKINDHVSIATKQGYTFTARHLIICSNAFAAQLLPDCPVTPARGQVVVTQPIPGLPFKGSFHFDEGFYYFRNLGNRILLGGARNKDLAAENTLHMDTSANIQQELERFIQTHLLPRQAFAIDLRWSGIMGFTNDKKPLLQQVDDHTIVAISCNGMGVALSPIMASAVADMLQ